MNIRTLAVCLLLAFVSAMAFAQSETYRVKPIVYDPGATGTIVSQWVKHLGLQDPGETDNENWGLLLSKNTASPTNAAAFGQVEPAGESVHVGNAASRHRGDRTGVHAAAEVCP